MTVHRLALYWAPEADDPLHTRGCAWLGRDAETNAALAQPELPGLDIAEITADPRGYGLHATLKPPFRLRGAWTEARNVAAVLAARTRPFDLPPLEVRDLNGFLALREMAPCPPLQAFADACVETLEPFRAPPTEAEVARRRPERLTPIQREMLDRWGYPYVFSEWRFHVTLSRRLMPEEKRVVLPAVRSFLGDAPARPRRIVSLCLFTQAFPGAPFQIRERLSLGRAADAA